MALWPFAQWGLDILGLFPMGTRQMKFLEVGIDYFTKWVEVKPLAKITQQNGRQFDNTPFREFCEQLGIMNHYFSLENPKVNRQSEVANQSLLKIIKTRFERAKGI